MAKLSLTMALADYDHVRDLTSGRIPIEGVELRCLQLSIEEIFFRFFEFREWDVSEFSMAKYCSVLASGDTSLTAIPVFPSRVFRHSGVYVRSDGSIREPADLRGRRVGVPEWAQTAGVYVRGMLADDYGLGLAEVEWFRGGVNQPGRKEHAPLKLPAGVSVTDVPDRSLGEMLIAGDLEAVITAHPPAMFHESGPITRLFPDYVARETDYFQRTGVFPIMHVVALRREVFDANPWVAMNLFKTFVAARDSSLERARDITASRFPIPWGPARIEEGVELFGELWPYGIEPNRTTLETFLRYCEEQGVTERRLAPEELVPSEVQSSFRV